MKAHQIVNQLAAPVKETVAILLDTSGSTESDFAEGATVLQKERQVVHGYIANTANDYVLCNFDDLAGSMQKLRTVKKDGKIQYAYLPPFTSGGLTYTHKALKKVLATGSDRVIIVTDGQTSSPEHKVKSVAGALRQMGAILEVIAVTWQDYDLSKVSRQDELLLPGMDLINMLGCDLQRLVVYSPRYQQVPFECSRSSAVDKKKLTFLGKPIGKSVMLFLDRLLPQLGRLNRSDSEDCQSLVAEVGRVLSAVYVQFREDVYVARLASELASATGLERELVLGILELAFECSKSNEPIMLTNLEKRLKDAKQKRQEFKDVDRVLRLHGTTMGKRRHVVLSRPLAELKAELEADSSSQPRACYLNEGVVQPLHPLGDLPKSCDALGNVYIGLDAPYQTTRQAIRRAFAYLFKSPEEPELALYVVSVMGLMAASGVDPDCEHMRELRRLAVIQTSMALKLDKNNYDESGFYAHWKRGELPAIHPTDPRTHASLSSNSVLNPLGLAETVWWALCMSMLGIFEEQRRHYPMLAALVGEDEKALLAFVRKVFAEQVFAEQGEPRWQLAKFEPEPESIFTMHPFEDDKLFVLRPHALSSAPLSSAQVCSSPAVYSRDEVEGYLLDRGCLWCKRRVELSDFVPFERKDHTQLIATLQSQPSELKSDSRSEPQSDSKSSDSKSSSKSDSKLGLELGLLLPAGPQPSGARKFRINMVGVTGAGKSTCSAMLKAKALERGAQALTISSDEFAKKGVKGKAIATAAGALIRKFDKSDFKKSGPGKLLIMDVCNERGPASDCFGFNTQEYKTVNFVPNYLPGDNYHDYECWALCNVLDRKSIQSGAVSGASSDYWLNPEDAGLETCLEVHSNKSSGVADQLKTKPVKLGSHVNMGSRVNLRQMIEPRAEQHARLLEGRDLNKTLDELLDHLFDQ